MKYLCLSTFPAVLEVPGLDGDLGPLFADCIALGFTGCNKQKNIINKNVFYTKRTY